MVSSIGVDCKLQLYSTLKARVVRVPPRDDRFNGLEDLAIVGGRAGQQLSVGEALEVLE
jgi:hypothetical protein